MLKEHHLCVLRCQFPLCVLPFVVHKDDGVDGDNGHRRWLLNVDVNDGPMSVLLSRHY